MSNLNMYKDVETYSEILGASSHRHIQLLFLRAKSDIDAAIISIENNNIRMKCKQIVSANNIIIYLRNCLNFDHGGEMTQKIAKIYEHLENQLFFANKQNSIEKLKNCHEIVTNLQSWWDKVND